MINWKVTVILIFKIVFIFSRRNSNPVSLLMALQQINNMENSSFPSESKLKQTMGLYHPLDGITNLKYKLFYFLTTIEKISKRKALAFNWDRCCHLAICLRLILFDCYCTNVNCSFKKDLAFWGQAAAILSIITVLNFFFYSKCLTTVTGPK